MYELFVADAGDMHYEIKSADGGWDWRVIRTPGTLLGSGHTRTVEEAKTQIVASTGRNPDGEWKVVKIGARATSGNLHMQIRWINTQWEWEVAKIKHHEVIAHDTCESFEQAKLDALKAAGLDHADWAEIV